MGGESHTNVRTRKLFENGRKLIKAPSMTIMFIVTIDEKLWAIQ